MSTYQFLNTLNFSWNEMENLISDEVEYLKRLRNDPDFVRFHIKVNKANQKKEANAKETVVNDSDLGILYKKGIITLKLLMTNPDFKDTKMYYDFVTENIDGIEKISGSYDDVLQLIAEKKEEINSENTLSLPYDFDFSAVL